MNVTIKDPERKRSLSYDNVKQIRHDHGVLIIQDDGGFSTRITIKDGAEVSVAMEGTCDNGKT